MTEDNTSEEPQSSEQPQRGSMRFQDAESTAPREPTLGEQRARRKALAEQEQAAIEREKAAEIAERKANTKRKVLIGSGVTVGLVGLVATFYLAARPDDVEAVCVDNTNTVREDKFCDENYLRSQGATYNSSTGFWILPLFLGGGGGGQYHYNYGGTGSVGSPVSGGTYQRPAKANISTKSGTNIQRGGFGISSKGSTSGGGKNGTVGGNTGKSGGS